MNFNDLLQIFINKKGSDLFITAGAPPSLKVNGNILPLGKTPLTSEHCMALVLGCMTEKQRSEFRQTNDLQFSIHDDSGSVRFRVSAFIQRGSAGMVLRKIESQIPTLEELDYSPVLIELAMEKRGIVLVVGGTGTGKSTTLAAMIGRRNTHSQGHVVTIEDPIEFEHKHQRCIVTQREVGVDTESFEVALENTLRQAPNVISIGEIRTREVMSYALQYAETGHLVLATLHANNANQALDRIVSFFDHNHHDKLFMDLSLNLKAIIAQQLVPANDKEGMYAAQEILLNTALVSDYIRKKQTHLIKELMTRSSDVGMQTFDQALFSLYEDNKISFQEALRHSDSPNDLRLQIKLKSKHDHEHLDSELMQLSINEACLV